MAASITGSTKFQTLVSDFVSTTAELGATIDPAIVATDLRQRIQAIAAQLGVTEPTALRDYLPDDWGRAMARDTYRQVQEREAHIDAAPDQQMPLHAVGRLVAALGQALLYFTINNAAADPTCTFNPKEASEAITGLGLALASRPDGGSTLTVGGNILAWTGEALTVFRDNLQQRRWSSCPCNKQHGQHTTDAAVLHAIREDLLLLPPPSDQRRPPR
jgi:hypothetical protein